MMFLLSNWRYIAAILAIVSLLGGFFAYRQSLISKGKEQGLYQCEMEKAKTINENIQIRKKQDKIIRPDDANYLKRLREHTA